MFSIPTKLLSGTFQSGFPFVGKSLSKHGQWDTSSFVLPQLVQRITVNKTQNIEKEYLFISIYLLSGYTYYQV